MEGSAEREIPGNFSQWQKTPNTCEWGYRFLWPLLIGEIQIHLFYPVFSSYCDHPGGYRFKV
jgi:hypothetical protein